MWIGLFRGMLLRWLFCCFKHGLCFRKGCACFNNYRQKEQFSRLFIASLSLWTCCSIWPMFFINDVPASVCIFCIPYISSRVSSNCLLLHLYDTSRDTIQHRCIYVQIHMFHDILKSSYFQYPHHILIHHGSYTMLLALMYRVVCWAGSVFPLCQGTHGWQKHRNGIPGHLQLQKGPSLCSNLRSENFDQFHQAKEENHP